MSDEACRIDVWLWRARFFKTRSMAARFVDEGRVRLSRPGGETRLDKPSRTVKSGDGLVFAIGGRLTAVRIEALGARRGPPAEAQTLYSPLQEIRPDSPPERPLTLSAREPKRRPAPARGTGAEDPR